MPKLLPIETQTEILARIDAGEKTSAIVKATGVSQNAVDRYRRRHLNGPPLCQECGNVVDDLPFAKTCKICRAKRRSSALARHHYLVSVYKPTDEIDSAIRAVYADGTGSLNKLAKKFRWSINAMSRRAAALGFVRPKRGEAWSADELEFLERNSHLSAVTLYKRMRGRGWKRSESSIRTKLARVGFDRGQDYTASSVASCFGVSYSVVTRWINLGQLKARRRGGRLEELGRDWWIIKPEAVYEFILSHPLGFEIRKVDQLWFIETLTQGKAGISISEALRDDEAKIYDEDAADVQAEYSITM